MTTHRSLGGRGMILGSESLAPSCRPTPARSRAIRDASALPWTLRCSCPRCSNVGLAEVSERCELFVATSRGGHRDSVGQGDEAPDCHLALVASQIAQPRALSIVRRCGVVVPQVPEL